MDHSQAILFYLFWIVVFVLATHWPRRGEDLEELDRPEIPRASASFWPHAVRRFLE